MAAAPAEAVRERLRSILARYGQTYTYKRGASSTTAQARISVMNSTTRFAWFTSVEVATWNLPAYVVTVAGDFQPFGSAVAAGDLITIKGLDHTVRKSDQPRVGAVIIKTVLYVSR